MDSVPGYSLEKPVTEVEFLRRELGVVWTTLSGEDLLSEVSRADGDGSRTLMICSDPTGCEEVLRRAPRDSVVLLQISDEDYSPERLALASQASVACVFRSYSTDLAAARVVARGFIGAFLDARVAPNEVPWVMRASISGAVMRQRVRAWNGLRCPVFEVPLGYTQTFAEAIIGSANLSPPPDGSLLKRIHPEHRDRPNRFFFAGQRGQVQRRLCLEMLRSRDGLVVVVDGANPWTLPPSAGLAAVAYADGLLTSRFAVAPPGELCNETFRTMEALIAGALPIALPTCLKQGTVASTTGGVSFGEARWGRILDAAERTVDSEALVRSTRDRVVAELDAIRREIRAFLR